MNIEGKFLHDKIKDPKSNIIMRDREITINLPKDNDYLLLNSEKILKVLNLKIQSVTNYAIRERPLLIDRQKNNNYNDLED